MSKPFPVCLPGPCADIVSSCSIACARTHRAGHGEPQPRPLAPVDYNVVPTPVAKSTPSDPYIALERSEELQTLFAKYPLLRSQLKAVAKAAEQPAEGFWAKVWTPGKGAVDGMNVLENLLREEEGVVEYADLVMRIFSGQEFDCIGMIQQQVKVEDAEFVNMLLKKER